MTSGGTYVWRVFMHVSSLEIRRLFGWLYASVLYEGNASGPHHLQREDTVIWPAAMRR